MKTWNVGITTDGKVVGRDTSLSTDTSDFRSFTTITTHRNPMVSDRIQRWIKSMQDWFQV